MSIVEIHVKRTAVVTIDTDDRTKGIMRVEYQPWDIEDAEAPTSTSADEADAIDLLKERKWALR